MIARAEQPQLHPSRDELLAGHEAHLRLLAISSGPQERRVGLRLTLALLEQHDGVTWQERWLASGAEADSARWVRDLERRDPRMRAGMRYLFVSHTVRPSLAWLLSCRVVGLVDELAATTDVEDFRRLAGQAARMSVSPFMYRYASVLVARLLIATGHPMTELTAADVEAYRAAARSGDRTPCGLQTALQLLSGLGVPGVTAEPVRFGGRERARQDSVVELVDRHHVANVEVRDLLVDYLQERAAGLDHSSLRSLVDALVRLFWVDLERHHPGIDNLRLPAHVAQGWKQRLRVRTDGQPRRGWPSIAMAVRGFYLDLAQLAAADPARWAVWVAPSPVTAADVKAGLKEDRRRTARTHARIRAAAPLLPALLRSNEQRLRHAQALLVAVRQAAVDEEFTVGGRRYRRVGLSRRGHHRKDFHDHSAVVADLDHPGEPGRRVDVSREEDAAFWAWAIVEVLRSTGIRREELLELTHLSIRRYRQPDGELVLLLQIAPSKTDRERVIPVPPDLAHVLARIVARVRDPDGRVPLLCRYDPGDRTLSPPLPFLLQHRVAGGSALITGAWLRILLDHAVARAGLHDTDGSPVRLTPHDYRRVFATEAVNGGLPIHIAAKVLGHLDLNTTRGYVAVYQEEVVRHLQTHLTRRRAVRPSEEYRNPTAQEWEQFERHFGERTVELGRCRRPYGTPCVHEHACIRCPMLQVDPAMRPRLVQIHTSTTRRLQQARDQGWLGEVEALELNLTHLADKLDQVDRDTQRLLYADELVTSG